MKLPQPSQLLAGLFFGAIFGAALLRLVPAATPGVLSAENRNPAPFPGNPLHESATYPMRFDSWFRDSLPFRRMLVTRARELSRRVVAGNFDGVIRGKDHFSFYATRDDGAPVDDFLGRNLFRRYELNRTVKALADCRAALAEQGIELVIVVPPDKITVYPELLPPARRYCKAPLTRVEQLRDALEKQAPEVKFIYLADALRAAKTSTKHHLYFQEDTHWNRLGAYIGIRELLRAVEPPVVLPPPEKLPLDPAPTREYADLWRYRGKAGEAPLDYELRVELPWPAGMLREISPGQFHRCGENPAAPDPRRVWLFGDSFAAAMEPYLATIFRETRFLRKIRIGAAQFKHAPPDLVIIEVVERHLGNLSSLKFRREKPSRLHLELFPGGDS